MKEKRKFKRETVSINNRFTIIAIGLILILALGLTLILLRYNGYLLLPIEKTATSVVLTNEPGPLQIWQTETQNPRVLVTMTGEAQITLEATP